MCIHHRPSIVEYCQHAVGTYNNTLCLSMKEFTDTRGIIVYRLSIEGVREHRSVLVGII